MADFEALRADIMWRFCLESEGSFLSQEEKCQQLDWRELWKRSLFSLSNRFGCTYKRISLSWTLNVNQIVQKINIYIWYIMNFLQFAMTYGLMLYQYNILLVTYGIINQCIIAGDLWQAVSDELFHILELFLTAGMHQTLQMIDCLWKMCILVD